MSFLHRLYRYYFPDFLAKQYISKMKLATGIVLMYHEVLPDDFDMPSWLVVKESEFKKQMQFLAQHFDVLSLDDAINRVRGETQGEKPFAVVTFDDGYKGNLTTVLPIMESMGLSFTVYLATSAIVNSETYWYDQIIGLLSLRSDVSIRFELSFTGSARYFSYLVPLKASPRRRWAAMEAVLNDLKKLSPSERAEAVRQITESHKPEDNVEMLLVDDVKKISMSRLVTIGSHTHSHEMLDQLDENETVGSISRADQNIFEMTGRASKHFAYPNGSYDEHVVNLLENSDYTTAVTTDFGVFDSKSHIYKIPRIGVGRFDSFSKFKSLFSSDFINATKK